jgi:hypothetical protein
MRALTTNVWVDGVLYATGMVAGEGVPVDVAARIGDHCWSPAADPVDDAAADATPSSLDEGSSPSGEDATEENDPEPSTLDGSLKEPPRVGRGSSRDAWAVYAEAVGVEVTEGMTRDDIVSAVDALQVAE